LPSPLKSALVPNCGLKPTVIVAGEAGVKTGGEKHCAFTTEILNAAFNSRIKKISFDKQEGKSVFIRKRFLGLMHVL